MGGDITISERHYNNLAEAKAKAQAEAKVEHEVVHQAGLMGWLDGHKGKSTKELAYSVGKSALQTVFAGAAIYYVATGDWFSKMAVFRDHWWLKPLVVMGLGYWLLRQKSSWAGALLAAGAAMFVEAWRARPVAAPPPPKKVATTEGPDAEAGGWDWVDDTYGRRGRWVETPNRGRTYVTEGHGAQAAERIAERVFEHARPA